ncbi:MAG: Omp28-related outer membrane protein [Saprospiraceae bacterium]|nr:Omp28-related outer membrane protein [Saprospiraceae bacterium]
MKKYAFLLLMLLPAITTFSQNTAKKYVLIEHFTNSRCSVCASRNPAFYTLIGQAQFAQDIHHVAVHPSFPYVNCVFHQANTAENTAWVEQYDIPGTPRIAMNGRLIPASNPLLRQDTLVKYLGQTSPVGFNVSVTGTGTARTALVEIKSVGTPPAGNYKLYVAVVEKTINMTTPNGEAVHHDVFRDMLTSSDGEAITLPAAGQNLGKTYNFNMSAAWNPSEIYVLAFIKETSSGLVMNSGTNLDPVLSGNADMPNMTLELTPNPVTETALAQLPADERAESVEIFAVDGKLAQTNFELNGNTIRIPTTSLSKGVYFVRIKGEKAFYLGKMVKQ